MIHRVIISRNIAHSLIEGIQMVQADHIFLLMDETTQRACFPLVKDSPALEEFTPIVIGATDTHKTLDTLAKVWTELGNGGGTRHSLLVNLGGGMVTDLGGFAASTFKRGIPYINVPDCNIHRHGVPAHTRPREHPLRLCRDAETRSNFYK